MNFFFLFLNIKFKYFVSFISIIVFYVCLFEKRYFQINSDWKVFCYKNDFSICHFEMRLANISDDPYANLAILSKSNNRIEILDIFNSSLTNTDVLSEPNIIFGIDLSDDFLLFDIKKWNNTVILIGLSSSGHIYQYCNWELTYKQYILGSIPSIVSFKGHSLEIILKENIVLIAGEGFGSNINDRFPIVIAINVSNGALLWRTILNNVVNVTSKAEKKNSDGAVFNHWKLKLMKQHINLDHLTDKSYHINLKETLPVYYDNKITIQLILAFKSIDMIDPEIKPKVSSKDSHNSVLVIHSNGFNLLDIYSGTLLATETVILDSHSTYTKWPSHDHGLNEEVFQVKFVSKLDHYSNDNIDIHHIHNSDSEDPDIHQHKIHCNLLFHKLNSDSISMQGQQSWFVGHLCDPISYMDYYRFGEKSWLEDPSKAVAPIITNDHAIPSGVWGRLYHVIGRKLHDNNSKNVIGISSDGLMTSYSSHGHINWRSNAQVGWLHISRMVNSDGAYPIDDNTRDLYRYHFKPSMTVVTLTYFKQQIKALIAIGFDSLSLIDLSDGYLLATHSLPCTPVDKPLIVATQSQGFFSMHGDQIVIVKCENMILGFSLIHYIPWTYFIVICVLMIVGLLLVMWGLDPNNPYLNELMV